MVKSRGLGDKKRDLRQCSEIRGFCSDFVQKGAGGEGHGKYSMVYSTIKPAR
jgi:hypothetical protein